MTTSTTPPSTASSPYAPAGRRLERSNDRMIGGVAAGLAEHFNVDVSLARIAFVALTLTTGAGLLLYLAMWLILPEATPAAPVGPPPAPPAAPPAPAPEPPAATADPAEASPPAPVS